ncbi:ATP-binding response regulator [Comamonas odontotermitis]|uniref:ATP-binding response regulator n=1 Tax=Comamonas odontotermitis TaxID=379895 RepID=UPI001CC6A9C3|nr:hybrid sensor histidine kinase/response regulator [Comamonas odontotermitis]UBB16182.1 hybrid sensor histidine kinase/response regulator [Comamonas odontotermitis]
MSRSLKLARPSVTARLLIILTVVALGIALVFVFAIRGLKRTDQEVRRLANVEMEQLVASTRLMQQSEMVASYARLVGQSNSQSERRLNMMELTDRMLWLDKLVTELVASGDLRDLGPQLVTAREALRVKVGQLSGAVFEPSVNGEAAMQTDALVAGSQALATKLSLLASHVAADLRRELNERGRQLSRDVANQQERLNWLVTALILIVIAAGIYMDASVSRRIVSLQREVRDDEFGGIHTAPDLHGDEIDQLAHAIASYKKHLSDHARHAQNAVHDKNRVLAGVSHDLRQPVQALNLFLETLRGSGLTPPQASVLEHARAASAASREMLDTLMDYSRIEAGVLDAKLQPVAIAGILRRLEKEFGPQADAAGLLFRVRDSEDWVYTDQSLLFMLLRNLVSNALRYTDQGGVLLAVRKRGLQRCIEVWDTGLGIAPTHHELIFQEFRQVGEDHGPGGKGLGLGLAIVRELADILNVQVSLSSRLGKGSVFRVALMAEAAPAGGYGLVSGLWEDADNAGYEPLAGMRVLVVDDEPLVRIGLSSMLEQWQCEVASAATVGQVQRLLRRAQDSASRPFDVVLTDLRLSKTEDGSMVVMAMREAIAHYPPWQTHLPHYIILTGDTAPGRLQLANTMGATLMHKPIDPRQLHDLLSRELGLRLDMEEFMETLPAIDPDRPD